MKMKMHQCEIIIIGAGIAGLWLGAHLRRIGYRCILLENRACGFGQTVASQGIIHGGTKYNLGGHATRSARALARMPSIWQSCLEGGDTPDLSCAKMLSAHQYLCSTGSISSRFTAFAARAVMQSKMVCIRGDDVPSFLQRESFDGTVYQLNEPVLAVPSLLRALVDGVPRGQLIKVNDEKGFELEDVSDDGVCVLIRDECHEARRLRCQAIVFTAGLGNEELQLQTGGATVPTQRRPLHMVMVRFPENIANNIPPIYTHFLGAGSLPRVTITTHISERNGDLILYLGGEIAESGVHTDHVAHIRNAQQLLHELLPYLPYEQARWATWRVDRAEPRQAKGKRPDSCVAEMRGRIITAWPTKLALAPHLAQQVGDLLRQRGIVPGGEDGAGVVNTDDEIVSDWLRPMVAAPPWDREDVIWNDVD